MRKLPAILVVAGLLVSLSACSPAGTAVNCTPTGNALLVAADGPAAGDPAATFPTPLRADTLEVATLSEGEGDPITSTDGVLVSVSVYDGETGNPLSSQQGALIAANLLSFVKGQFPFTSSLTCTTGGSRFVLTGTAEQLFGPDPLGLDPTKTLVVIADVTDVVPGQATGTDQLPRAGFPAVVFTPQGQPGFTFPDTIPTELGASVLRQGRGATVAQGDTLFANVTGIAWGSKSTFASSFDNQGPTTILAQELGADGSGLVSGLATSIIGQQVGSRVLVVVPPANGYPAGSEPTGVVTGDTLVFVVDILGIR